MTPLHMGNTDFHEIQCEQCFTLWLITAVRQPGFADWAHVRCPICGTDLGEFRIDVTYTIDALALIRRLGPDTWLNLSKGTDGQFWLQILHGEDGDELADEVACPLERLRDCLNEQLDNPALADELVAQSRRLRAG